MKTVVIIGGGASGMMAATQVARSGCHVVLLEQNEKLGKKIYITGKGRCNLTNLCSFDEFLQNVVTNGRFLSSAISKFSPQDTVDYFAQLGLATKLERGKRVFPISDKASDVTLALNKELTRLGVEVRLNTRVTRVNCEQNIVKSVEIITKNASSLSTIKGIVYCDYLIIATGGFSYPSTGSNGSGHTLLNDIGHSITKCVPSLTGLIVKDDVFSLQGLSLKNVTLSVSTKDSKKYASELGEMLFTHEGISGPIVLSLSARLAKTNINGAVASIDLKPALTVDQLDARILRDINVAPNRDMKNLLLNLLPEKLVCVIMNRCSISSELKANSLSASLRRRIIGLLKGLTFTLSSLCGFEQAVITCGGVNVKEVVPSTMASKLITNLYICGELLDVDALTGGFNLQIAFATGYVAGQSVALKI